jgi:myo-inositol-1(or 4)-monophosphatase
MGEWLITITSIAREVAGAVKPLLGTAAARVDLGQGAGGDITNQVDAIAEDIIAKTLKATLLPIKLITEERGIVLLNCSDENDVQYHAIVDPVDGSVNATRNLPFVATSIAIANGPTVADITDGVVMNISTGDLYAASKGQGAWLNDAPMAIEPVTRDLHEAIMGIDINPKSRSQPRSELVAEYACLMDAPKKVRILGSNALETCLVAQGGLDCFLDIRGNLRLLDIAASWLVVEEAGGVFYHVEDGTTKDLDDLPLDTDSRLMVFASTCTELWEAVEAAWPRGKV